ncbi:MAG TPA: metallophosphatase [Bacteriovoracaceae bacterium]|nr:metallophosphatase [Bacteriovoracaceae bacterium]
MNTLLKSCLILFFFILTLNAEARLLHIIHTNDLHSYFNGVRDGRGGYARLKTRIQQLRDESSVNGIDVLQLDAGDFGEGTSYFMSKEGSSSVKALGMLGTEVSVIGNHDHLMGGSVLGDQIRMANVPTRFLSANIVQTPDMKLGNLIKPYVDLVKGGIKIRIIGLSTNEIHHQYSLKSEKGSIRPSVETGVFQSTQARKEGRELVIALTHIGQGKDAELARASSEIDVIVGGHSHDFIENVRWEKNKKNRQVPIVQAGAHGLAVGSFLIDLKDNGTVEVVNYKLHKIEDKLDQNNEMLDLVSEAEYFRNEYFEGRWDEVVGESEISLSGYVGGRAQKSESCWGKHMARMTREARWINPGDPSCRLRGRANSGRSAHFRRSHR